MSANVPKPESKATTSGMNSEVVVRKGVKFHQKRSKNTTKSTTQWMYLLNQYKERALGDWDVELQELERFG